MLKLELVMYTGFDADLEVKIYREISIAHHPDWYIFFPST